jgi:DNA-binding transcriptional regulator YiaG
MATQRLRLSGDELRSLRHRLNWTQATLAHRLRVHPVTVGRWECGAARMRPSHAQLIRLIGKRAMKKLTRAEKRQQKIDAAIRASSRPPMRPDAEGADWIKTGQPDLDVDGKPITPKEGNGDDTA